MPRRVLHLVALIATLGVAGCGSTPQTGPRAIDGVFPAQGDIAALPVRVWDAPGAIRSVSITAPNAVHEGVSQVPGRDDALYVSWIGGMCDRSAVLVFEHIADDVLVTLRTERDFGGCRMAGISRILMLELHQPTHATNMSLELLD